MRKIVLLLLISWLCLTQANGQSKIANDYSKKDFDKNIIFLGIEHSGALLEFTNDGAIRRATLMSDSSAAMVCSLFPNITKSAMGKEIVFLLEGYKPLKQLILDTNQMNWLRFPYCFRGQTLFGSDTRPDSIKIQSAIVMDLLDPVYKDGLNGSEKTFEEAFEKKSEVDLGKIAPQDRDYFQYWSKVAGLQNRIFENYMVSKARDMEQNGYFVVVICGAAHVAKIIAENDRKDLGYALCVDMKSIQPVLRAAKTLMVLEMLADDK